MKYTHETYGIGFAVRVTPQDRSVDVLHYLQFGTLMGGSSLDGVEWEEVVGEEYNKVQVSRAKALIRSISDVE